ncbi:MAG: hypothetical protein ACHQQ3_12820, partial [Gemmatimonadales bacterium]
SLGSCLGRDSIVVRDSRSPSGWRFRSSYHAANKAYRRAFLLLPSIHLSLRGSLYRSVRRLLMTGTNDLRQGYATPPDTTTFAAMLAWLGDTLVAIPYPRSDVAAARAWTVPQTNGEALRRQRESFREIATAWATDYPTSPDAQEALALSLELLGDPACLDTLRRARRLAADAPDRTRLAAAEVWLRLKFSTPSRLDGVRAARALADSLLGTNAFPGAPEPALLASLAALTGRGARASTLFAEPASRATQPPPASLSALGPSLLVYAALGGPVDTLRAMERRVLRALVADVSGPQRPLLQSSWLVRPAMLAFPSYRFAADSASQHGQPPVAEAQAAFVRGDTTEVRRIFGRLRETRRAHRPGDITFDALFPEAWLLAAVGDRSGAAGWLDPTLEALATTAPQVFADPARAASLVQAMALRADLAERMGDSTTARKWAAVVTVLWSDADGFLKPTVDRMARLAHLN